MTTAVYSEEGVAAAASEEEACEGELRRRRRKIEIGDGDDDDGFCCCCGNGRLVSEVSGKSLLSRVGTNEYVGRGYEKKRRPRVESTLDGGSEPFPVLFKFRRHLAEMNNGN